MKKETSRPAGRAGIADQFAANGYYFPIDVLSTGEASAYRRELAALEKLNHGKKLGNKSQLNLPHIIFTFADAIVRHPRILDAVEAILGPDILVWRSTFLIKEPHSESYVSWHQDLRYWGLDSDAEVSAWVALSPATEANGCMRFVPGSHKAGLLPHKDTFADSNLLTRGQEADIEINEHDTTLVSLAPGQMSLHHGKLLHASGPNRSDERRIGFAINYIAPHVRQLIAKEDFAVLVRGKDKFGHFQYVPSPTRDMDEDAIAWHQRILSAQNKAIYAGA